MMALFACGSLLAQSEISSDFSWVATDSLITNSRQFELCKGNTVVVTLTTSEMHQRNLTNQGVPISNGHPTTSVLIPYPVMVQSLTMTTTISFSTPVADLRLLIRDLDDDVPPVGPEETFSNFRINGIPTNPTSINPTAGSYATALNVVNPLAPNCNGWFRFASGGITSISFDYWRVNNHYAFLLDSLKASCDLATAIDNSVPSIRFGTYPNPCSDFLDIVLPPATKMPTQLAVFDIAGRQMMTSSVKGNFHRLAVDELSNGVYFLRLQNGTAEGTKKFVVMR